MVSNIGDKGNVGKRSGAKKVSNTGASTSSRPSQSAAPAPPRQPVPTPNTAVKKGPRAANPATEAPAAPASAKPAVRPQKLPAVAHQTAPAPQPKPRPPPQPLVQGNSIAQRARILLQARRANCPNSRRKSMDPEIAKALTQLNKCVSLSPLRPPGPEAIRDITPDSCLSFSSNRNERHHLTSCSSSPFPVPLSAHKSAPNLSPADSTGRQIRSYSRLNKQDPFMGSTGPPRDLPRQTSTPNIFIRSSVQNNVYRFADRPISNIPSQPKNKTPDKSLDTLHTYVSSIENRMSSMEVDFIPSVEKLIQDVSNSIHRKMTKKGVSNPYRSRSCMKTSSVSCVGELPARNEFSSCSSTSLPQREISKTRYVERMDQVTRRLFKNKDFMFPNTQTEDLPSTSDKLLPLRGETSNRPLRTHIA